MQITKGMKGWMRSFEREQFQPDAGWTDFFGSFTLWICIAGLLVLADELLKSSGHGGYLDHAVADAIGIAWFNVLGTAGMVITGTAIATAKTKWPHKVLAKISYDLMISAYTTGVLIIGILLWQIALGFSKVEFDQFRVWRDFFVTVILALQALEICFGIWFIPQLIYCREGKTRFIEKLASQTLLSNLLLGFGFSGMAALLFALKIILSTN